jgi:hypothetical protein
MSYKVKSIAIFERQAKKLFKKYSSLKNELFSLIQLLKEDPTIGTSLGRNCYKIRLAIAAKGKGKSGGARVITHFIISEGNVYLLSIYDKSEKDNLTNQELVELLAQIPD